MTTEEQIAAIEDGMTDEQRDELVEHRGGCRCFISPPCNAHSEPLTLAEVYELGWMEEPTP